MDSGPQVSLTEASPEGIAEEVKRVPGANSKQPLLPGQQGPPIAPALKAPLSQELLDLEIKEE